VSIELAGGGTAAGAVESTGAVGLVGCADMAGTADAELNLGRKAVHEQAVIVLPSQVCEEPMEQPQSELALSSWHAMWARRVLLLSRANPEPADLFQQANYSGSSLGGFEHNRMK
jgi:hypothetical protein